MACLGELASVIGHAARVGPLRGYYSGLLLPCERNCMEPTAAATAPNHTSAQHQSLLHVLAKGGWSDAIVLAKVRELVPPLIERHRSIEARIIDGEPGRENGWGPFVRRTAFPGTGRIRLASRINIAASLEKQTNCQVAVSLSLADHHASLPVAYRLYLPEGWAKDEQKQCRYSQ